MVEKVENFINFYMINGLVLCGLILVLLLGELLVSLIVGEFLFISEDIW